MKSIAPILAALLFTLCLASTATAKKSLKGNGEASGRAITALLASSEEVIPVESTCHGAFGGSGPAKVHDLLGMELATLSRGTNTMSGACHAEGSARSEACHVAITHQFGEEASSADIRFRALEGRADVSTLSCVLTP
jgi:hypothetical protein